MIKRMGFGSRVIRAVCLFILNHFFSGTHFWCAKRLLLRGGGISCGRETKVVGPMLVGRCCSVSFGKDCWIGANLIIHGDGQVEIGDRCDLAPDVSFITGTHEIGSHDRRAGKGKNERICIGSGCWVCAKAVFLGGVSVGDGCVVGACTLVNRSMGNDSFIIGIPGRAARTL